MSDEQPVPGDSTTCNSGCCSPDRGVARCACSGRAAVDVLEQLTAGVEDALDGQNKAELVQNTIELVGCLRKCILGPRPRGQEAKFVCPHCYQPIAIDVRSTECPECGGGIALQLVDKSWP